MWHLDPFSRNVRGKNFSILLPRIVVCVLGKSRKRESASPSFPAIPAAGVSRR
jgi:hypothetical protein